MRRGMVLGDLRVQAMKRAGGGWSYTILWPDGTVDEESDGFLRTYEGRGTQKTYAYVLVDHLRWRVREGLSTANIRLLDLHRYMGGQRSRCRGDSRGGCRRSGRTLRPRCRLRPPA